MYVFESFNDIEYDCETFIEQSLFSYCMWMKS